MNKFLARLKEPSTYAALSGLGVLGVVFKISELAAFANPGTLDAIMGLGSAISGAVAIFMPEKGAAKPEEPKPE